MSGKIILEINSPLEDPKRKLAKAIHALGKALGTDFVLEVSESPAEPTPYRALRELSEEISAVVEDELQLLFENIVNTWLKIGLKKAVGAEAFMLNGKIFINPKTGKLLTVREWEIIKKDLGKLFQNIYGQTQEAIVKHAIATGKLLQYMDPLARLVASKSSLGLSVAIADKMSRYKHLIDWAEVYCGELITDMTARSRKAVVQTIMQGYQDKLSSQTLRERLFDNFSEFNRDFRKIAETECARNFSNGFAQAELKVAQGKPVFVQGISGAGACSFCRENINGKIFVLLEEPPVDGGDQIIIDGKAHTAIWVGKSNVGRSRPDWWVAFPAHPSCRCSWVQTDLLTVEYEKKLREAMKE